MKNILQTGLFIVSFGTFVSGCASIESVALKRAAYDFDCPQSSVRVEKIAGDSFSARGCGRKQLYTCATTSRTAMNTQEYSCWPEGSISNRGSISEPTLAPPMHIMNSAPAPAAPPATGF